MGLTQSQITQAAEGLISAAKKRAPIDPLTAAFPGISVDDAYRVQLLVADRKINEGGRVIGKKIGLTSRAMQEMFGVAEPDYGHLFEDMLINPTDAVEMERLLQPRIEGEIAFILERDLKGPGITPTEVLRATAGVTAALEIIDSRIMDWKIKIQDTIADNASGAAFVVSPQIVPVTGLDLRYVGYVMTKNGQTVGLSAGAAVLGSPAHAVAWLANKLGEYDIGLKAGEVILSGAAPAAIPVGAGDAIHLTVDRVGSVSCYFK
jgi:2-keto-4-pentenoate hydratase